MKKIISIIAVLIAMCSVFSKAKTNETRKISKELSQNKNDYSNITGTPEDSVIFYGGFAGVNDYIFTQIDSNFEPDTQAMIRADGFVSKPVKPGSRYMLEYLDNTTTNATLVSGSGGVASVHFTDNGYNAIYNVPTSILIIDVPKEPGLYYFGYYNGSFSIKMGELYTDDYSIVYSSTIRKASSLNEVLKYYKGTEWEPLINEELKKATVEREKRINDIRAKKSRR